MWKRIGSILRFCYNENGALGLDSTCFAVGKGVEYICCVLNSSMGHYLLKDSPKTGTGDLLISVQAVEPIKIPLINIGDLEYFKELLKCENQTEIDHKVFNLYGLSLEEEAYIEHSHY